MERPSEPRRLPKHMLGIERQGAPKKSLVGGMLMLILFV